MHSDQEILVMGGGIIGLAIALELRRQGASVTVLSRSFEAAAAHAAAGMLAPQAEELAAGAITDLCLQSLALYPEWIRKIEELSGLATDFWPTGILAPVYAMPAPDYIAARTSPSALWLDRAALQQAQPGLGAEVVGGWWYPEEGQVDSRALARSLRLAAEAVGVQLREGETVTAIQQHQGKVSGVCTDQGEWRSQHYILATGAWSAQLLPLPVVPRKGQMLSLMASSPDVLAAQPLHRVLYGEGIYLVPRKDGRIVIGATNEAVGFTPGNTAAGVQQLLNAAIRLYPPLQPLLLQECWWGFRPATPDDLPILGQSPCENLTLATGHYRNGILLAPITAKLIAAQVWQQQTDPLLTPFSWQRFLKPTSAAATSLATRSLPLTLPKMLQTQDLRSHDAIAPESSQHLVTEDSPLTIAGRSFRSRLMTGTGKYANFEVMRQSVARSGCEIVTVAVRRVQTNAPGHEGLAEALDWSKIWMLPNTAGCQTAEEAIRVARLGREMAKLLGQEDNNFVKLEVIPDAKYLLPDPIGTLHAAEQLVKEGFAVLPYINADPLLAKRLEEAGCATVMPLGSPIGSGQGIRNAANIQIIIENAKVPVVVDAGIGTPSEAAMAMEMGADALLINTAIAQAQNPVAMAQAMGLATQAGRLAYLAGRIPVKAYASASSPLTGTITG